MIKPAEFKKLLKGHEDCLPMLTLSEFFDGNTIEDSIAPNQYGYGRPSLAEIWGTLRKIEALPSVAWIRVVLHYDTAIKESGGEEVLYLSGDTIALCTTARPSEIESLANCEWLCSDGVIEVSQSYWDAFSCVPPVPKGYHCLEIVWD